MYSTKNLLHLALRLATMVSLTACSSAQPNSTLATSTTGTSASPTITVAAPTPGSSPTPEQIVIDAELSLRQIQPGAFVVTHAFPWPANSLVVEMANADLVLVGTPGTPEATRQLLDWLTDRFGKRNIIAIDTGYHYDNLGGNRALIERGIPVYGSDLTVQLLAERGAATRALILSWLQDPQNERYYQAHKTLPYIAPTQVFDIEQGLDLEFGSERVQVYYPGPSHAPDNVVVYFPSRKLLFGGCMILSGDRLGNTEDAELKAWPAAVQKLNQFDFEILIPGHGDRLDAGLIQHTLDLLAAQP